MISFVLIISFLLHIITFAAIYQLLKQIQTIKQMNTRDIQEVLATYLQEIKEENNRLQKAVREEDRPNEAEDPVQKVEKAESPLETANTSENQIYENEKKDYMEASLHSRILQLHDGGLSESEIAQKLNCGKTEAALIIKLYGKK